MYGELFLQKGYCTDPDQREFGEKFPFPFRAIPCLLLILHHNATYHTASHPHATMGLCHAGLGVLQPSRAWTWTRQRLYLLRLLASRRLTSPFVTHMSL